MDGNEEVEAGSVGTSFKKFCWEGNPREWSEGWRKHGLKRGFSFILLFLICLYFKMGVDRFFYALENDPGERKKETMMRM